MCLIVLNIYLLIILICRKMKLVITCLSVPGIVALIIFENRLFGSVILIM